MHLNPNSRLAGKYIILQSLLDSDVYIMYLAKAPSLAEEVVLTEFFPQGMASRDENGYITVSPDDAEILDNKLEKFTNDCRRLMTMPANRFWGLKEVLSELGTSFIVSKKLDGELLYSYIENMAEEDAFNENMIDSAYEAMRNVYFAGIPLQVSPDMTYVEGAGIITFMFDYKPGHSEAEMVQNTAKLMYTLLTKKSHETHYDPSTIPDENKYKGIITGALGTERTINSFTDADNSIEYTLYKYAKEAPPREYIRGVIVIVLLILILGAGVAFGIYTLAEMFLG